MRNELSEERVRWLFERMLDWIDENCSSGESAKTLEEIGFTKEEIIAEGFDYPEEGEI